MVRQGGNSKRNFYGASRSGRNDFQSKFIGATGTEKKNEKGDTKATAITASVLSVLPDVLFILVTMSAVTSVIVVTDLRPIVNHSLSSLSSTSSVL